MGVAIRAPFGVERDHNAHTVRMVLRDIFDHSGNITQIAKRQTKRAKARLVRRLGSSSVLLLIG